MNIEPYIDALQEAVLILSLQDDKILYASAAAKSFDPSCVGKKYDEIDAFTIRRNTAEDSPVINWLGTPAKIMVLMTNRKFPLQTEEIEYAIEHCLAVLSQSQDTSASIHIVLKTLCEYYGAEYATILSLHKKLNLCEKTHEYAIPSAPPSLLKLHTLLPTKSTLPWIEISLRKKRPFSIKLSKITKEQFPDIHSFMTNHLVHSFEAMPFSTGQKQGFICVSNITNHFCKYTLLNALSRLIAAEFDQIHSGSQDFLLYPLKGGKKQVFIQMFGNFVIHTDFGSLFESQIHSLQICKFLAYLILNRANMRSAENLADILWPNQYIDDPYGAIRNLAFRTRKVLSPIFKEQSLIIAKSGSYMVNPAYSLNVDAEMLEHNYLASKSTVLSPEEKFSLYHQAVDNIHGTFLPNLAADHRITPLCGYYNSIFIKTILDYVSLLDAIGNYAKILELCAKGMDIDFLNDELHIITIQTLLKMGNRKLALDHLQNTIRVFTDEYNINPSEKMIALFHKIQN